ncbi:Small CPxCG-related zinc finger protein [Pseudomonas soli]
MSNAPTLLERYTEYNNRLKSQGIKFVEFACPGCRGNLETRPAPRGEKWDTLSECPFCNALFLKITDGPRVYALIPSKRTSKS